MQLSKCGKIYPNDPMQVNENENLKICLVLIDKDSLKDKHIL